MEKRSREFLQVAFYLSSFGKLDEGANYPEPPIRLNVKKWNEAYRIFYEKLNAGRTVLAFERSLKNARDAFDSHMPNSNRIGWRTDNKKPNPLGKEAQKVFDNLIDKSESEVWQTISNYSDLRSTHYRYAFEDIITLQESELEYKKSKTEGGEKVVNSITYERSPSLKHEAINIHGLSCMVCGFNFEEFYGEWGEGFIEVHHNRPLHENQGTEIETDPEKDLSVLCANCHRMVHRKKNMTLTIVELKNKIKK